MSFETSCTTEKLDQALAKAQAEFTPLVKNARNPHFKSEFADLRAVWFAVREPLAKHQINVTQWPVESAPKTVSVLTRISHNGEFMQSVCSMPLTQDTPQGHASAYTYLKRAALKAVLGLAEEDETLTNDGDDDGETIEGRGEQQPKVEKKADWEKAKKPVVNHAPGAISPMQQVSAAITRYGRDREVVGRWIRAKHPTVQFPQMTQALAAEVINKIMETPDEGFEMELRELKGGR